MLEKILKFIFSMKMMALALILFLMAIGAATIIESKFTIQTAKIIIYNAIWFELLLVFLGLTLIANIVRYKMFQRAKIAMLLFHLSFIVILIGAGVTRYISFEGQIRLPEPDKQSGILRPVDFIYSAEPKFTINIDGNEVILPMRNTLFLSEQTNNYFNYDFTLPTSKKPIEIEYVNFQSKHIDSLVINDSINDYVLDIVTGGMESSYLAKGGFLMAGDIPINFEKKDAIPGIELSRVKNQMMMKTSLTATYLPMSEMRKARESGQEIPDSLYQIVPKDSLVPFRMTTLYNINGQQIVFKQLINHAKNMLVPSGKKNVGLDYLTVKIKDGKGEKTVVLAGGMGQIATEELFRWNGSDYRLNYGSVPQSLPFSLACNDFKLDKYAGSNAPSTFESTVTVLDPAEDENKAHRIFMNNVLDYKGYRFFQSSYFPDESGTILSVNHDWWGTNITYVGYLLMTIGMVMSIFAPIGRFRDLNQKLSKLSAKKLEISALVIAMAISTFSFSQNSDSSSMKAQIQAAEEDHTGHDHVPGEHDDHDHEAHQHTGNQQVNSRVSRPSSNELPLSFISEEHSEKLAYLLVLDFDGRVVPLHTVCDEILRKLHRKNTYTTESGETYNALQTVLSMHLSPSQWMDKKIIYVSKVLRDTLHLTGDNASISDLLTKDGLFKLADDYQKAHQKLDKEKGEYDKQLIKLVERYQIAATFPNWDYLRLIPVRTDASKTWYAPMAKQVMEDEQTLFRVSMEYFKSLFEAIGSGDYKLADQNLKQLIIEQRAAAGDLAPSELKVSMEISYNKMNIFSKVQYAYLLLGLILLIIYLFRILRNKGKKDSKTMRFVRNIFVGLMIVFFVYHGVGLTLRWYIADHAPWSNGYEAIVFIAWVCVLSGLLFSSKNAVVIAASGILAFFMLFVTEMNLLDPEITQLQPVLKSYWLMVHVAIITGSYGFLGLGAILGFINLILYSFRTKDNGKLITLNITEISYISEMTITIGLFMLTIGTFLGGIWANESWGRYWGWDPKETWALVSVLVYAVILHLRFIPALSSKFVFNVVSFWGYSAIIFTFFGVNFYLVGLHSYAQGEGLAEVPSWIATTVVGFYIFTELAWYRYKIFSADKSELHFNFFAKKTAILAVSFIVTYFVLFLFKVVDFKTFLEISGGSILIFIITNIGLFLMNKARK